MQYTVTVGETTYEITPAQLDALDLTRNAEQGTYHLLHNGTGYRCEVTGVNHTTREVHLLINGRPFTARVDGPLQQLVKQLGFATTTARTDTDVTAPMPGLILSIAVGPGDAIEAGTPLLVLEAMKMENVIKATATGTVKAVHVSQGQAVEKRQRLIELE